MATNQTAARYLQELLDILAAPYELGALIAYVRGTRKTRLARIAAALRLTRLLKGPVR
jgi:hypothetical protein